MINISKLLKQKRDSEERLRTRDPAKGIVYSAGTPQIVGGPATVDPAPPSYTAPAAQSFRQLTDTPASYAGQAGKAVIVKSGENGLEFGAPGVWGYFEPLTDGDLINPQIIFTPQGDLLTGMVM